MIAHKFRITNPQDYGLYLLVNGGGLHAYLVLLPHNRGGFPFEQILRQATIYTLVNITIAANAWYHSCSFSQRKIFI